jgi:predicted MFS family arabinose efflux permease
MLAATIPAGLLPQIHAGRGVSVAQASQPRTVYAAGSMRAAIPLTELMRGLARHNALSPALTASRSSGWNSPTRENADDDD